MNVFSKDEINVNNIIAHDIANGITNNSSVVDFGFGNTALASVLNNTCKYLGIDTDRECVIEAKKEQKSGYLSRNTKFLNCSIFDYDDGRKDYCICSRLFHHFNIEECNNVLVKMVIQSIKMVS